MGHPAHPHVPLPYLNLSTAARPPPDPNNVSDVDNHSLYTGRWQDYRTGFYHNRNRYYHAQLGRFPVRDSIGYNAGDPNLYRYIGNGPVGAVDPWGLAIETSLDNARVWETWCGEENLDVTVQAGNTVAVRFSDFIGAWGQFCYAFPPTGSSGRETGRSPYHGGLRVAVPSGNGSLAKWCQKWCHTARIADVSVCINLHRNRREIGSSGVASRTP